jgi:hypothetical protein
MGCINPVISPSAHYMVARDIELVDRHLGASQLGDRDTLLYGFALHLASSRSEAVGGGLSHITIRRRVYPAIGRQRHRLVSWALCPAVERGGGAVLGNRQLTVSAVGNGGMTPRRVWGAERGPRQESPWRVMPACADILSDSFPRPPCSSPAFTARNRRSHTRAATMTITETIKDAVGLGHHDEAKPVQSMCCHAPARNWPHTQDMPLTDCLG